MIDWKKKLCSRKLWVAVVGLVTGILLLFGVDKTETEVIGGLILTAGSVVAYILGEGLIDAASTNQTVTHVLDAVWDEDEEDEEEDEDE